MEAKLKLLEKIYHDPASPAGFAGSHVLYKEAKKIDPSITLNDVKYYLSGNRTYTLHKHKQIKFKRAKTIPSGLFTDIQMDLADMQKLSRENKGYKYILFGVCVLSKRFFAVPVKSKQFNDMSNAMEVLFKQIPILPSRIFTDNGKEFILKGFYEKYGITKQWSSTKTIKAALAERGIRTLKSRLYKYFSEKQTLNWIDVLQQIIIAINNTKSRITEMRPVDVNFKNAQKLWEKLYKKEFKIAGKIKLKKDDPVRLANYKEVFDKGYLPNWSDEILNIDSVKKGPVNTYRIKDDRGEVFKGNYYKEDLQKLRKHSETSYRIEKFLRKRIYKGDKQVFVKFKGYKEPVWIDETDIINE